MKSTTSAKSTQEESAIPTPHLDRYIQLPRWLIALPNDIVSAQAKAAWAVVRDLQGQTGGGAVQRSANWMSKLAGVSPNTWRRACEELMTLAIMGVQGVAGSYGNETKYEAKVPPGADAWAAWVCTRLYGNPEELPQALGDLLRQWPEAQAVLAAAVNAKPAKAHRLTRNATKNHMGLSIGRDKGGCTQKSNDPPTPGGCTQESTQGCTQESAARGTNKKNEKEEDGGETAGLPARTPTPLFSSSNVNVHVEVGSGLDARGSAPNVHVPGNRGLALNSPALPGQPPAPAGGSTTTADAQDALVDAQGHHRVRLPKIDFAARARGLSRQEVCKFLDTRHHDCLLFGSDLPAHLLTACQEFWNTTRATMIFSGKPGNGKSTVAKLLAVGAEFAMFIDPKDFYDLAHDDTATWRKDVCVPTLLEELDGRCRTLRSGSFSKGNTYSDWFVQLLGSYPRAIVLDDILDLAAGDRSKGRRVSTALHAIIAARYSAGLQTAFTTNLKPEQAAAFLPAHLSSRLSPDCWWIFTGDDFRKSEKGSWRRSWENRLGFERQEREKGRGPDAEPTPDPAPAPAPDSETSPSPAPFLSGEDDLSPLMKYFPEPGTPEHARMLAEEEIREKKREEMYARIRAKAREEKLSMTRKTA